METGHKELESDLHVYLLIFLYVDSNIFGILVPRGKNSSSSLEIWDFAFDSGTRNCESPSGGNTHFPSRIYKKHFLYSQKYFSHLSMKTHIDFSERLSKGQEMGKQYGGSLPHCCQMSDVTLTELMDFPVWYDHLGHSTFWALLVSPPSSLAAQRKMDSQPHNLAWGNH